MPTYKITDPTSGKVLRVTGDSPPSEAELNDIFSSQKGTTTSPNTDTAEVPEWGRKYPNLYGVAGAARETLGPILEAAGVVGGGVAGAPAGPAGGVAGAGLGYAGAHQLLNQLDVALGNKKEKGLLETAKEVPGDVATGAAMEAGGQLASKGISAAADAIAQRVVKPVATQVLGATTGSGPGATEAALKGSPAFKEGMRGKVTGDEIVDNVRGALQAIKDNRAASYTADLQKVSANRQDLDVSPITNKVSNLMQRYNVKVDAQGNLDLSRVAMGKSGRNDIEEIVNTVSNWGSKPGDKTATGLDVLKRQLDDFYSDSSQARQFVTSLRNSVKDTIVQNVPEYGQMTKGYAEATNLIKDIESGLMLRKNGMSGRVTGDMTLRRLASAMRENFPLRKELLDTLGNQSGTDVADQVAGYSMSQMIPRGLVGKLAGGSAVYASYLNPKLWPLLAASSPRAVGEFLTTFGMASRKAGMIKPVAKAGLYGAGAIGAKEAISKGLPDITPSAEAGTLQDLRRHNQAIQEAGRDEPISQPVTAKAAPQEEYVKPSKVKQRSDGTWVKWDNYNQAWLKMTPQEIKEVNK